MCAFWQQPPLPQIPKTWNLGEKKEKERNHEIKTHPPHHHLDVDPLRM